MEEHSPHHPSTGEPLPETGMSDDLRNAMRAFLQKLRGESAEPAPASQPSPEREPSRE